MSSHRLVDSDCIVLAVFSKDTVIVYPRILSVVPRNGKPHLLAVISHAHSVETQYAIFESKALAVADALDKSRFFTLGCEDHKPLLKLFGDRFMKAYQLCSYIQPQPEGRKPYDTDLGWYTFLV